METRCTCIHGYEVVEDCPHCDEPAAAAPTPVERDICPACTEVAKRNPGWFTYCPGTGICARPAAPAESQGVERAQPVERKTCKWVHRKEGTTDVAQACRLAESHAGDCDFGFSPAQPVEEPREPTCPECKVGLNSHDLGGNDRCFHCAMCGYVQCESKARERHDRKPSAVPVEGVERVTDDAPARVEPQEYLCMCGHRRGDHGGMGEYRGRYGWSACGACKCQQWRPSKRRPYVPAAQPAKHTDDRPAETIPERYTQDFKDASGWHNGSYIQQIHRELGRAETRIEVLEAALREVLARFPSDEVIEAIMADKGLGYRLCPMDPIPRDSDVVRWRAALAAPSGEKEKV